VCQRGYSKSARFGLYCGRNMVLSPRGQIDCYEVFGFNEAADDAPLTPGNSSGRWTIRLQFHSLEAGVGQGISSLTGPVGVFEHRADPNGLLEYRKITLMATLAGTSWTWEGKKQIQSFSRPLPEAEQRQVRSKKGGLATDPDFSPAGGFGFYVSGGEASIRNVRVRRSD
jgi:hypothetical protein